MEYIVFDFDGVLCDSVSVAYDCHNQISHKYNLSKIYSQRDYLNILDNQSLKNFLSEEKIEEYYAEHRELMLKNISKIKIFENVRELFQLDVIIISSTSEILIKEILLNNNLVFTPNSLILGRETAKSKIERFNILIKNLNIKTEDVVYVGDTLSDLTFCEKVDINMIGSCYGYSSLIDIDSDRIIGRVKTDEELKNFYKNHLKEISYGRKV